MDATVSVLKACRPNCEFHTAGMDYNHRLRYSESLPIWRVTYIWLTLLRLRDKRVVIKKLQV